MRTIAELQDAGIIRTENHEYDNAVVECYSSGGIKGVWIDNIYYPAHNTMRGPEFDR